MPSHRERQSGEDFVAEVDGYEVVVSYRDEGVTLSMSSVDSDDARSLRLPWIDAVAFEAWLARSVAPDSARIMPRGDWTHRACPGCGDVFQWPLSRVAEPTYCNHTGRLNFGSTVQVDSDWTKTVAVEVRRAA